MVQSLEMSDDLKMFNILDVAQLNSQVILLGKGRLNQCDFQGAPIMGPFTHTIRIPLPEESLKIWE